MKDFILDQRLKGDTVEVLDLGLCRVLLMDDRTVPWLILVPMRAGLREIHELSKADLKTLMDEMTLASRVMELAFRPDKINVGALGNIVSQLHIHVIGRKTADRAWPGPVWGAPGREPYNEGELGGALAALREAFRELAGNPSLQLS